jgi:hypothetical protein
VVIWCGGGWWGEVGGVVVWCPTVLFTFIFFIGNVLILFVFTIFYCIIAFIVVIVLVFIESILG